MRIFYIQKDNMLKDEVGSLFKDVDSKLEEELIFGGNACTFANESTEENNLTFEKAEEVIRLIKEDLKITVRKCDWYPFKGSDGITYIGMAFKKVEAKDKMNKLVNSMIEKCDLDGKCIVSEEVYEYLKENHLDKFKFE